MVMPYLSLELQPGSMIELPTPEEVRVYKLTTLENSTKERSHSPSMTADKELALRFGANWDGSHLD